ncbi:FAD binding domain-containing protein [Lophium mytilinum]|uniref:Delta(24)-sterol reductase n=1 Tax=Lophium mytilinum TaxID=390894 RepID=A0A6A6R9L2_9PEZI|nr:FAD binding domain-containing protein [Lophium mytilinum]
MEEHEVSVASIAATVRRFHDEKIPFRIYHGSTNSTRQTTFQRDKIVDTSTLKRVLNVDMKTKTVLVEPNVPMDVLVDATMECGLLPPVVMEFPGITAGGGFVGTAGESSSFKHGFFDRTVNWIEMVLASGEVVRASKKEKGDLFHGSAGSFGTLGVLTLLEIQCIDAKPYVELVYHPVSSPAESVRKTQEVTKDSKNDYVDGILFGPTTGAIITGRLTSKLPTGTKLQKFSRPFDPWFYMHAEKMVSSTTKTELVPIRDYLFRYDRGAFWTARYAFKYFFVPFNWVTRTLLDHLMHTRVMYHALHASGHMKQYIIQDLALPVAHAEEFIEWVNAKFGFFPIWLCPLRPDFEASMGHPGALIQRNTENNSSGLLNVGVWGPGPTNPSMFTSINRELEAKLRKLGGIKWLYAQAFYTEEEFWSIYDRKSYNALREKYGASGLPTVYDKVKVRKEVGEGTGLNAQLRRRVRQTPFLNGLYGVYKAIFAEDYLLAKASGGSLGLSSSAVQYTQDSLR